VSRSVLGFLAGNITGHYRTAAVSGITTGIAAGATIFTFRNASAGYIRCLLQRLRMQMSITVPFTAAQELYMAAYVARSFSAADTGGTALTLSGVNATLNSIADAPCVATMSVASTVALTPGTRTLDAQPFLFCPGAQLFTASSTTTNATPFVEEYVLNSDQQFPLNLQGGALWNNVGNFAGPEGIVIQNGFAMGAGGSVRFVVEVEWIEYDARTSTGSMS
jgi:hypothetical protein